MKWGRLSIVVLVAASAVVEAANVVDVSGSSPSALVAPVTHECWAQSVIYSNVVIEMPLVDVTLGGPIVGAQGTAYLMRNGAVGPGTTPANEFVAPVSVSGLTSAFVPHTLFSGLTLPPGVYCLVLAATTPGSMSPGALLSSAVITYGTGASSVQTGTAVTAAAYPPASNFIYPQPPFLLTITGNLGVPPASVPTSGASGIALLSLIIAAMGLLLFRRRTRQELR